MSNADYIDWPGQSGKTYRYWFLDRTGPINAVAGNYAFVMELANGSYRPVYFGETDDLQDCITSHERWNEAVRRGAKHVMGHTTPAGGLARCDEEMDLVQRWNPPLNVQYRTTG